MKKVALIDPHGFEKPLPCHLDAHPERLEVREDVLYPKGMPCGELFKLSFRAQSPDGKLR